MLGSSVLIAGRAAAQRACRALGLSRVFVVHVFCFFFFEITFWGMGVPQVICSTSVMRAVLVWRSWSSPEKGFLKIPERGLEIPDPSGAGLSHSPCCHVLRALILLLPVKLQQVWAPGLLVLGCCFLGSSSILPHRASCMRQA